MLGMLPQWALLLQQQQQYRFAHHGITQTLPNGTPQTLAKDERVISWVNHSAVELGLGMSEDGNSSSSDEDDEEMDMSPDGEMLSVLTVLKGSQITADAVGRLRRAYDDKISTKSIATQFGLDKAFHTTCALSDDSLTRPLWMLPSGDHLHPAVDGNSFVSKRRERASMIGRPSPSSGGSWERYPEPQ